MIKLFLKMKQLPLSEKVTWQAYCAETPSFPSFPYAIYGHQFLVPAGGQDKEPELSWAHYSHPGNLGVRKTDTEFVCDVKQSKKAVLRGAECEAMSDLRGSRQRVKNEVGLQCRGKMEGPRHGGKAREGASRKATGWMSALSGLTFFIKLDSVEQIPPSLNQHEWISCLHREKVHVLAHFFK